MPVTPTLPLPAGVAISVGSGREETARVLKAQFGNGYAQRAADGLNSLNSEYGITFENLTREESAAIVAFLRAQAGYQGFYFTPPDETVARLWTCEKWRITHTEQVHDTLTCTFTEVFAP
jgi:phage-related protein